MFRCLVLQKHFIVQRSRRALKCVCFWPTSYIRYSYSPFHPVSLPLFLPHRHSLTTHPICLPWGCKGGLFPSKHSHLPLFWLSPFLLPSLHYKMPAGSGTPQPGVPITHAHPNTSMHTKTLPSFIFHIHIHLVSERVMLRIRNFKSSCLVFTCFFTFTLFSHTLTLRSDWVRDHQQTTRHRKSLPLYPQPISNVSHVLGLYWPQEQPNRLGQQHDWFFLRPELNSIKHRSAAVLAQTHINLDFVTLSQIPFVDTFSIWFDKEAE